MKLLTKTLAATLLYLAMPSEAEAKKFQITVNYCNYGILFRVVTSSLWGEELRLEGLLKKPLVENYA